MSKKLSKTIFVGLVFLTLAVFACVVVFYLYQDSIDDSFVSGGVSRTSRTTTNIGQGNQSKPSSSAQPPRPTSTKSSSSAASSVVPTRQLTYCNVNSHCGSGDSGLECRNGICIFVKVPKLTGDSCGEGGSFCPSAGDTCKNGKCVSGKIANNKIELYAVSSVNPSIKPRALGGGVDEGGSSSQIQCKYYSGGRQACTDPSTNLTKTYPGVCCLGYDAANSSLMEGICEGEGGNPNRCDGIGDGLIYNQNNPLISQTPIPDGQLPGRNNCTFIRAGCGPSSVYYILRDRGINEFQDPTDLLNEEAYSEFDCDGSDMSDNFKALKANGLNLETVDQNPATLPATINTALAAGNQVFIRIYVVQPDGKAYFHYAVLTGLDASGQPLVYDPILAVDGKLKDPNDRGSFSLADIRANGVTYDIVNAFIVGN